MPARRKHYPPNLLLSCDAKLAHAVNAMTDRPGPFQEGVISNLYPLCERLNEEGIYYYDADYRNYIPIIEQALDAGEITFPENILANIHREEEEKEELLEVEEEEEKEEFPEEEEEEEEKEEFPEEEEKKSSRSRFAPREIRLPPVQQGEIGRKRTPSRGEIRRGKAPSPAYAVQQGSLPRSQYEEIQRGKSPSLGYAQRVTPEVSEAEYFRPPSPPQPYKRERVFRTEARERRPSYER